ncbi:MAG: NAD(P)H-hydrate dehydratase [Gemmatimonadota bacterium]|jgi:NAD(P)H-hydrate epimerase|nr:MAG: NAD(P)H-hydrate dehydratase [Gemmatimonadota bacterium]
MSDGSAGPSLPRGAEVVWLPTADEMAELDRWAAESGAIPERALIESAGREIAHAVQRFLPRGSVLALAGSGHNGADALVAARTLAAWGREVRAILCGSRAPKPDVLVGWPIRLQGPEELGPLLATTDVVLDGLLGTGVTGAPREPVAGIIRTVNAAARPVVAVDGPSGADFTSGAVHGECVRARFTVGLGWPKVGLLRHPARGYCGDLIAVEIGFPPPPRPMGFRAITDGWVARLLPARPADAHKGRAGYVTIVAGQRGMAGASVLAARGAVRAGAGIVRVVGAAANREIVQRAAPETIFVEWEDEVAVGEAVAWADAVAVGPGLGGERARRALVEQVLDRAALEGKPAVVDADGLNAWAGEAGALAEHLPSATLVTPHPGELSRLMNRPIGEIMADPPACATEASQALGCAVLLKGAPSWVAGGDEPVRVSTSGDVALATGGVGDVLTGVIAAQQAAGLSALDAASAALQLSGYAALQAPDPIGHSAADLPDRIPEARRRIVECRGAVEPYLLFLPAPRGSPPSP